MFLEFLLVINAQRIFLASIHPSLGSMAVSVSFHIEYPDLAILKTKDSFKNGMEEMDGST